MNPFKTIIAERKEKNQKKRIPKSTAIIQPYVFPYIGYFQLITSVEKVVFYDDVNFIKKGWINRNRILLNNSGFIFTIPLKKASQNKRINEISPLLNDFYKKKLFQQFKSAYAKAPFYKEIIELFHNTCEKKCQNIGDLGIQSVLAVCDYLDLPIDWVKSSEQFAESKGQEKSGRLIQITKQLGCTTYINPIGGKELYRKDYFKDHGVDLGFLQTREVIYSQFTNQFVPNLSIVDVLMFNDKKSVLGCLNNFEII